MSTSDLAAARVSPRAVAVRRTTSGRADTRRSSSVHRATHTYDLLSYNKARPHQLASQLVTRRGEGKYTEMVRW